MMIGLRDNRTLERFARMQAAGPSARTDKPGHFAVLLWRRATAGRPPALFSAPARGMPAPQAPTPTA